MPKSRKESQNMNRDFFKELEKNPNLVEELTELGAYLSKEMAESTEI
jgi:hypothetical protein